MLELLYGVLYIALIIVCICYVSVALLLGLAAYLLQDFPGFQTPYLARLGNAVWYGLAWPYYAVIELFLD